MRSMAVRTGLWRVRLSTEAGQAWCRLLGAVLVLGACLLARLWRAGPELDNITALAGGYVAYAGLWLQVVGRALMPGQVRRVLSIVVDQMMFALALYLGGAYATPLIWTPVSIALGNGLRFGRRYTQLSVYAGAACSGLAIAFSPYWLNQPALALGLMLSIVVIPLYASALNARMARDKRTLERRAARFELASMTDSVTGALNRPGFMNILGERTMRAGHGKGALMLLDLDGFKAVNDACGHAAGDMVLVDTVNRLARCFGASDRVARIGGDEFAVLLTEVSDQAQVEQLAALALDAIADIRIENDPHLALSASIGICMLPHPQARSMEAMLHLADSLMYEAKRSGKNRFRISGAALPGALMSA